MRCDQKKLNKLSLRTIVGGGVLAVIILFAGLLMETTVFAAEFTNRIMAIEAKGGSGVQIIAEKEIGSRYTSYLLSKPPRVVFDFQGADISALPIISKLSEHPVHEIRVSLYESAAVKSGRVELLLTDRVPYKVQIDGNILNVDFTPAVSAPAAASPVVAPPVVAVAEVKPQAEVKSQTAPAVVSSQTVKKNIPATSVMDVIEGKGEILVRADGELDRCKSFVLKNPSRYVVDCFGVSERIAAKIVLFSGPIKQVRVGNYPDKVRFVFEGNANVIDRLAIFPVGDGLAIRFDGESHGSAVAQAPVESVPVVASKEATSDRGKDPVPVTVTKDKVAPLVVEKVDFKVEDGKSLVIVTLSAPGEVMQPIKDKTLLRFGIKGATITPSLRRTIDASAFPSVIRQITPYIVSNRGKSDVRFAVELKGDTPYQLKNDGKVVTLIVENGPFTKVSGPLDETLELPLAAAVAAPEKTVAAAGFKTRPEVITNETLKVSTDKKYTGQLVSLNFDNIEIRNVLLLIAEVSDTNIIANDDVKGVITLRLNNVPWDQALDVILESKGLGMEKEGNILRIAPSKVISDREIERKKQDAEKRTLDKVLVRQDTKVFFINYGPVEDIAKKIEAHLKNPTSGSTYSAFNSESGTSRVQGGETFFAGTVSADTRTRSIIVTTTTDRMPDIKLIIDQLDVPDQQVTIEARIVEANSNFTRDLGVSWGISQQGTANGPWDLNGAMITGGGSFTINPGTQATNTTGPVFNNSAGLGSMFSFGRIGIDSTILDLRLSALETSGYGKIVSTPRITTSNGTEAKISQGQTIPYQSTDQNGNPTLSTLDAKLELTVTPVINPDKSMILTIKITNNSLGPTVTTGAGSASIINKKEADTIVLVKNGETTVIGGIFIENEVESEGGIPLLRSIPILGHFFKSTKKIKEKTELMIFITPRIVE